MKLSENLIAKTKNNEDKESVISNNNQNKQCGPLWSSG